MARGRKGHKLMIKGAAGHSGKRGRKRGRKGRGRKRGRK